MPVLLYMRDVETLTDVYYSELRRTPTGKDPVISKFMERWGVEEITHGEVLNRFLNEAGIESEDTWQDQVRRAVSNFYHANTYLTSALANLIGHRFTATHMTYGELVAVVRDPENKKSLLAFFKRLFDLDAEMEDVTEEITFDETKEH